MARPLRPSHHGRGRSPGESPYTRRVNLLLTPQQFAALQTWATDEMRTMPNLIRLVCTRALAGRDPGQRSR